ncbi:hypothetical protein [Robiginitalea marina]|uniref:Uncharacterized protein n=1 Tax=Robiginitalea marina TaxID=2954105 RepID=A0ABT1B0U5_9FLAO|nr:hypothetical protein [Robiginitalea marina]MCO5725527.1 hypothetical protein [Robiginitalea marina]
MEERLEQSLEQIIFILQERQTPVEFGRLIKTLHNRNADKFYDINFKLNWLKELGYIHDNSAIVQLTKKGFEFKGFGEINYQKYLEEQEKSLNLSNLELQNENLGRQAEIDQLTIENLRLQNRQLKRYVIFSIIAFLAGALLTNLKDIIEYFRQLIE